MSWPKGKSILVVAPHTDDAELGCGASIARFVEESWIVSIAVFSTAEQSLPKGVPPDALRQEFYSAMRIMGIPESQLYVFDYPVRKLSYHRQEVLEDLVQLKKALSPSIVLVPASSDLHQDHQVLHMEALRVFKDVALWGYELPWNQITFSANAFVVVRRRHLVAKWKALSQYRTQIMLRRPYFSWSFVESLARVRGLQVKEKYAEAFEVIRIKVY